MAISLAFGAVCSALALYQAFANPNSLPFDSREQLIWMWRFVDPGLLPNDPFADYLASLEPAGTAFVYRLLALLGLEPFVAARILPAILGLFATWHAHRLGSALTSLPGAGVSVAILTNIAMWSTSDLSSGTARMFVYPLLPWFLAAVVRERVWQAAAAVIALALCYPPVGAVVTLTFLGWSLLDGTGRRVRQSRLAALASAVVAVAVVLPQASRSERYGPVLTAAEGRSLDELQEGGEFEFFVADPAAYWIAKFRSGLLATQVPSSLTLAAALPVLLLNRRNRHLVHAHARILPWLLVSSVSLWAVAHAMLFRLYQPSRYTLHSLRIVVVVSVGVLVAWSLHRALDRGGVWRWAVVTIVLVVALVPVGLRFPRDRFPQRSIVVGRAPEIYDWLRASAQTTVVSSLAPESNNIPALTARTSLTASDFGLPWHTGYHRAYRQRTADVIEVQHTDDPTVFRTIVQRYGITALLVEKDGFDPRAVEARIHGWLRPHRARLMRAAEHIRNGRTPILALALDACGIVESNQLLLIDAACVLSTPAAADQNP